MNNQTQENDSNQNDWLLSEYEWAWTTQSDINSRINTVYTAAMTISVALLGAIAIWAFSPNSDVDNIPPIIRALIFAMPNTLIIPFFLHNIGQRRGIVQIAGYWKVMIEKEARRRTWASRIEAYREELNRSTTFTWLRNEANDPIPFAYWAVYFVSAVLAFSNCYYGKPLSNKSFIVLLVLLFASIAIVMVLLTKAWKDVLRKDLSEMSEIWRRVKVSELAGDEEN